MVNKSVEVYAGTVDYQTFGAVGAPETIVLLHASATGAWSLAPLAEILSDRYRVLVPNLDGYGMSKLDCARCPATFRHVQTVERFLKAQESNVFTWSAIRWVALSRSVSRAATVSIYEA